MADSKITQLPLSPYALDKDLMVVVTGHLEEGSYPQNAKMPLSYIRRYVVRLNLISNAVSGIDTYYNSGLNILTSWTTGIHAIPGNNIEVQFDDNTPASNLYGGTGPICHSGIISTTGLNAYDHNLMRIDYDAAWPHSGGISQTGLNTIKGNLIDIVFSTGSPAAQAMHNRDGNWDNEFTTGNLGELYHSGIISFTGVNAVTENLIVKEYQENWPYTGIYYNTGLNARAGNHIEIMHSTSSDANFFYPGIMGGRYQSGVISVTGLNVSQSTGNLITNHIDPNWPHKNILHTTGLNISNTNLAIIDSTNSLIVADIENTFPHKYKLHTTGLNIDNDRNVGKYNQPSLITYDVKPTFPYEYVLHTTGLNAIGGNRIDYTIQSSWPHKYEIDTTGLNIVNGNTFSNALNGIAYNIEPDNYHRYDIFSLNKMRAATSTQTITNSNSGIGASRTSITVLDEKAFISYNNIYKSKPSDSLSVLAEFCMRMPNDPFSVTIPPVADSGSSNDLKINELGSVTGTTTTIAGLTDSANTDTDSWDPVGLIIHNSSYPLELKIDISGVSVSNIDQYSVTFTTHIDKNISNPVNPSTVTLGPLNNGWVYEKYRTSSVGTGINWTSVPTSATTGELFEAYDHSNPYTINSTQNMKIAALVNPSISSSKYNINGCIGVKYTLTNPNYKRTYSKYLGVATQDGDGYLIGDDVYRYHEVDRPAQISFTTAAARYLKCESAEQSPTISITTQPQAFSSTDGTAAFTGIAKLSDYTDPLYQWQKAESGTSSFSDIAGANNSVLSLTGKTFEDDNGDKYRLKIIAYDGLTTATSNEVILTVQAPTLTFTSQPTDQPVGDDNTAEFCSTLSANIPGTTLNYQWQISTNGGSTYSNIVGETSSCLSLSSINCGTDDGNLYRVSGSAVGFDGILSDVAELRCIDITIDDQPDDLTVNRGTGLLTVSASQTAGSPFNLYYVWQRSANGGASYYNVQSSTSNELILNNLTYDSNDQDLYRVQVRLEGFADDVEVTSDSATLTVQEIDITTQPDSNKIYGRDLEAPNAVQYLVPTTGGNINLSVIAIARNSSETLQYQWQTGNVPTNYWESPSVWGDLVGETNATISLTNLTENDGYKFYRCLVDDQSISISDTGMVRQTSNTVKITTSTFIADSSVTVDDNGSFATIERDGTSVVSETDFVTFCYDLTNGIGFTTSVDAQTNQQAGLNLGTGLAPLGPTGIARLLAIHPDSDNLSASLSAGTQFNAGDIVNIQVTGNVNQYLARINVPLP